MHAAEGIICPDPGLIPGSIPSSVPCGFPRANARAASKPFRALADPPLTWEMLPVPHRQLCSRCAEGIGKAGVTHANVHAPVQLAVDVGFRRAARCQILPAVGVSGAVLAGVLLFLSKGCTAMVSELPGADPITSAASGFGMPETTDSRPAPFPKRQRPGSFDGQFAAVQRFAHLHRRLSGGSRKCAAPAAAAGTCAVNRPTGTLQVSHNGDRGEQRAAARGSEGNAWPEPHSRGARRRNARLGLGTIAARGHRPGSAWIPAAPPCTARTRCG